MKHFSIFVLLAFYVIPGFSQKKALSSNLVHVITCDDVGRSSNEALDQTNIYYSRTLIDEINVRTSAVAISYNFTLDKYDKKTILDRLDNIKTSQNDMILFHFSGNGISVKNDSLPVLFTHHQEDSVKYDLNETLFLSDIYTILRNKPHRMMLLVFNGCRVLNDSISDSQIQRVDIPSTVDRTNYDFKAKIKTSTNAWESLFCKSKGNYIALSCKYGEANYIFSGYDIYDYYLSAVLEEADDNQFLNWSDVLDEAGKRTIKICHSVDLNQHPCWSEVVQE